VGKCYIPFGESKRKNVVVLYRNVRIALLDVLFELRSKWWLMEVGGPAQCALT
jgi:hypothetical protein